MPRLIPFWVKMELVLPSPSGLYAFFLIDKTITVQVAASHFPSSLCFNLRHVACRHLRKGVKDRERLCQKSYLAFKADKPEGMGKLQTDALGRKGTAGTGHNDNAAPMPDPPMGRRINGPGPLQDSGLAAYFGSCIASAQPHTQQDNAGQADFIKESRDVGEGIGYLRLLVWHGIVNTPPISVCWGLY
ncbi:hypothetical protein BDQ17DRAFT_1333892 [Cyathus striatus]|nr:hypothetical protein BDQ17DRAFT_1333892 [Cyathus striatus]